MNDDENNKIEKHEPLTVVVRDPRELGEVQGYFVRRVERGELRAKLVDWAENPFPIGALAVLELRHKGSRPAVNRWSFKKGETDLDALTNKIASDLENDAQRLPNAWQEYVLEAYFGTAGFPQTSWKERVRWNEGGEYDNDNSAPLRADGLAMAVTLQKAFRDLSQERIEDVKSLRVFVRGVMKEANEREAELWARIRYLEVENARMFGVYQEALDRKQEREIKAERAREFLRTLRELADTGKVYIPVLANHFLGDKVFPVPDFAHPMLELLKQLYEAITRDAETLGTIMEALSKNKTAFDAFGRLMTKVEDWRDLAKERAKIAAQAEAEAAKKAEEKAPQQSGERPRAAASGMRGIY